MKSSITSSTLSNPEASKVGSIVKTKYVGFASRIEKCSTDSSSLHRFYWLRRQIIVLNYLHVPSRLGRVSKLRIGSFCFE